MRHDLRTPFCGLLTIAEVLEKQETDSEKKTYLGHITNSARVLLSHLNDILDYIHSNNGELPILEKPFNLKILIDELNNLFLPAAQAKQLQLTCVQAKNIPIWVRGDRLRTQRILMNLLANAIQFTEQGYIHLNVNLFKQEKHRYIMQFIVQDTGIGIPQDKHDFIFQQFNRLTSSYQNQLTGKGLGLSIVKH